MNDLERGYDIDEHIALDELVPLIATPSSPGNVISSIDKDEPVHVTIRSFNLSFRVRCELTKRQKRVLLDGGLLRYLKASET